ncbi:hypothetical protein EV363DRAFT_1306001 [Boletus edulis]|nr:hypothetical protein EV363DRAFT_1306001 [Boletus edulis]
MPLRASTSTAGDLQTMEDAAVLFERCLDHVLPICNDKAVYGNSKLYGQVRDRIISVLHACFDTALICLRDLAIDGFRDAPTKEHLDQLFFHVGRKEFVQLYQEQHSIRKPDMVLVSAADFSRDSATDSEHLDSADKSPTDNFEWRNVCAAVKFKYMAGLKCPLSTYTAQYTTPSAGDQHPSQNSIDGIETEKAFLVTCSLQESKLQSGKESSSAVSQSSQVTTGRKRKVNPLESEPRFQEALGALSNQESRALLKRLKVENACHLPPHWHYGFMAFQSAYIDGLTVVAAGCDVTIWHYDRQSALKTCKLSRSSSLSCAPPGNAVVPES